MRQIILIAHNIRSAHNIGSLLRTAEGLGIKKVYLTGYSPYPKQAADSRLPHDANKTHNKIIKTSLGAENFIEFEHVEDIKTLINDLKNNSYCICALEQNKSSVSLPNFQPPDKIALIVGREVDGIEPEVLGLVDQILEIPMSGHKESFNVAQAAAIALYHLKFTS